MRPSAAALSFDHAVVGLPRVLSATGILEDLIAPPPPKISIRLGSKQKSTPCVFDDLNGAIVLTSADP
jgi:hypothetical protein